MTSLIYIDEFHVSIRSSILHNWSLRGYPATLTINPDPWIASAIIAISSKKIEGMLVLDKSINKKMFMWFIYDLWTQFEAEGRDIKKICLIFDNSRIHWNKDSQEFTVRHGIRWISIPPYSPQLNAAENVIGLIKVKLRKAWLENKQLNMKMLKRIVDNIKSEAWRKLVLSSRIETFRKIETTRFEQ